MSDNSSAKSNLTTWAIPLACFAMVGVSAFYKGKHEGEAIARVDGQVRFNALMSDYITGSTVSLQIPDENGISQKFIVPLALFNKLVKNSEQENQKLIDGGAQIIVIVYKDNPAIITGMEKIDEGFVKISHDLVKLLKQVSAGVKPGSKVNSASVEQLITKENQLSV